MARTRTTLAAGTVLLLAVAGCGDDTADVQDDAVEDTITDDEVEATDTSTPPEAADTGTAADGQGPTVIVEDIAFQQDSVTVTAGTPVTWDNRDGVAHTVTSGEPGSPTGVFDEPLPANGEVSITVEEPGTYAYFCEIHPQMTAELVVE